MTRTIHAPAAVIEPMKLDRDYDGINRLLELEQWPFTRADLELSHAQPRSTALVARQDECLLGFFATHHFGDVGYLDMMVVDTQARGTRLAQRLAYATHEQMCRRGMRAFVAHSTNDSFDVFRFFGYTSGINFTLMRLEPRTLTDEVDRLDDVRLNSADLHAILALDARVFGMTRRPWIECLLQQATTRFVGRRVNGHLIASICLRARRQNAVCLDGANAVDDADLFPLVDTVVDRLSSRRIECFVRTESRLHRHLAQHGFTVPDFFQPIGPLVEWRKGVTGIVGMSPLNRTLSWF